MTVSTSQALKIAFYNMTYDWIQVDEVGLNMLHYQNTANFGICLSFWLCSPPISAEYDVHYAHQTPAHSADTLMIDAEEDGDDRIADSESNEYWVNGWMVAYEDPELVDRLFVAQYNLSKAEYWPVFPIAEDPAAEAISHAESDEGSPAAQPIIFGSFGEAVTDVTASEMPRPVPLKPVEHILPGHQTTDAEAEAEPATLARVPLANPTTENAGNDTETHMTAPDPVEHVTAAEAPIPDAEPPLNGSCVMDWEAYKEQRLAMKQMIGESILCFPPNFIHRKIVWCNVLVDFWELVFFEALRSDLKSLLRAAALSDYYTQTKFMFLQWPMFWVSPEPDKVLTMRKILAVGWDQFSDFSNLVFIPAYKHSLRSPSSIDFWICTSCWFWLHVQTSWDDKRKSISDDSDEKQDDIMIKVVLIAVLTEEYVCGNGFGMSSDLIPQHCVMSLVCRSTKSCRSLEGFGGAKACHGREYGLRRIRRLSLPFQMHIWSFRGIQQMVCK